jgi:hypothetical protein
MPIYSDCRLDSDKVDAIVKTSNLKPRKKKKSTRRESSDNSQAYEKDLILQFLHGNIPTEPEESYSCNIRIFPKVNI